MNQMTKAAFSNFKEKENEMEEENNYMAFGDIPRPVDMKVIEEENNYMAFGDVPKPLSFEEDDDEEDNNYMVLDDLPPPLPPRSGKEGTEKAKCRTCDADQCMCYIEVIAEKRADAT